MSSEVCMLPMQILRSDVFRNSQARSRDEQAKQLVSDGRIARSISVTENILFREHAI